MEAVYVGGKPLGAGIFAALNRSGVSAGVLVSWDIDQLVGQLAKGKVPFLVILCERDGNGTNTIPLLPKIREALPEVMLALIIPYNEASHLLDTEGPFTLMAPESVDPAYLAEMIGNYHPAVA